MTKRHKTAKQLFSYPLYWAECYGVSPFLPTTREEMDALGWDSCDVIIVTGAADVRVSELRAKIPAIASVHRKPVDIEDLIDACERLSCRNGRAATR